MVFIVFVLGLCVGSFLNVLIDRLPKGEQVLRGRSKCDYCKKTLRWFELIPLLSFVMQHGTCLRCHKKLSIQYPLIEFITGLGFVWIYLSFDYSLIGLFAYWIIFSSLLVIFVSDLKYQIIPDSMVVAGIIGTILLFFSSKPYALNPMHFLLTAILSSTLFFLLWLVTKGKSMGFGDVKLAFLLGLLLGYPKIIVALYSAFLTGAIFGVILILKGKRTLKSKIAFGPFLIVGALIAFLWSDTILLWWKTLL